MANPMLAMDASDARSMAELIAEVFNIPDREALALVTQVRVSEPLEVIVSVGLHIPARPRGWHAGATRWEVRCAPGGSYKLCLMERDVRSKRQQERERRTAPAPAPAPGLAPAVASLRAAGGLSQPGPVTAPPEPPAVTADVARQEADGAY